MRFDPSEPGYVTCSGCFIYFVLWSRLSTRLGAKHGNTSEISVQYIHTKLYFIDKNQKRRKNAPSLQIQTARVVPKDSKTATLRAPMTKNRKRKRRYLELCFHIVVCCRSDHRVLEVIRCKGYVLGEHKIVEI